MIALVLQCWCCDHGWWLGPASSTVILHGHTDAICYTRSIHNVPIFTHV